MRLARDPTTETEPSPEDEASVTSNPLTWNVRFPLHQCGPGAIAERVDPALRRCAEDDNTKTLTGAATGNVTGGVLKEVVGGFDALWAVSAVSAVISTCLFMQLVVDEDRQ